MPGISPTIRKAAIVVGALDRRMADRLLDQMSPDQAALVRGAMMELEDVSPAEQESALAEFCGRSGSSDTLVGIELDDSLARKLSLGGYTALTPRGENARTGDRPFLFLHNAQCEELVPFLEHEHPQTIALVASHLPPNQAAQLLSRLSSDLQAIVVRRLIDLEEADPEVVREVERGLESRVSELLRGRKRRAEGMATVAKILEAADPRLERLILSSIARTDRPLAHRLAPRTLTFADLERLDNAALAGILAAADTDVTVLALAGASVGLAERVLKQLPPPQAKSLRYALERLGPTRLADVEAAQQEFVRLAVRLEEEREITLSAQPALAAA